MTLISRSFIAAAIATACTCMVPSPILAQATAVHWWGAIDRLNIAGDEPIGTEIGSTGLSGLNALARHPSGELVAVQTRSLGRDVAGFYALDEATGEAQLVHLVEFPPDPSRLSNANVGSAAFAPNGDLYFTNVIPSRGGDPRPRISDLYVLDWATGHVNRVGSNELGGIQGLAFNGNGKLYGWEVGTGSGVGAGLVTIDLHTGAATDVDPLVDGYAAQVQSIAFDASGRLWGARRELHELDHRSGTILSSRAIGSRVDVRGLEFPTRLRLDVKPRSSKNLIAPTSHGLLRVAIMGSPMFDVAQIVVADLELGPAGASPSHRRDAHYRDVDHDGSIDLVSHFGVQELGLSHEDRQLCLSGTTFEGAQFQACDEIRIAKRKVTRDERSHGAAELPPGKRRMR